MEYHKVELGPVTYEVQRAYKGDKPAAKPILDRITKEQPTDSFNNRLDPVVK